MSDLPVRARLESTFVRGLMAMPDSVLRRLAGRPIEVDGQRLEPDSQLLVTLRNLASKKPYHELSVADARQTFDEDCAGLCGGLIRVAEVRDLDVAGRPARLYVPETEAGGLLVYYHGGGWVLGSLESHEQPCRFLARAGSVRVLSVDYRLAPDAKFPAAAEDGLAAFEWARDHAAELGSDPTRVAVGGDSAGGNIAAVVAHQADPRPALALLIYPVCDLSKKHESCRLFGEGFLLTERNMDWFRTHYLPDERAGEDPRASPLLADDLVGVPRTYLAVAGFDPLRDEALAYGRRLEEAGVDVEVVFHEGLQHGFANTTGVNRTSAAAMGRAAEVLKTL